MKSIVDKEILLNSAFWLLPIIRTVWNRAFITKAV